MADVDVGDGDGPPDLEIPRRLEDRAGRGRPAPPPPSPRGGGRRQHQHRRRRMIAWTACLTALCARERRTDVGRRWRGEPSFVGAFGDGWSTRGRGLPRPRATVAKLSDTPPALTRSVHPALEAPCNRFPANGLHRKRAFWGVPIQAAEKFGGGLICWSTLSDEAVDIEIRGEAPIEVHGANWVNVANGASVNGKNVSTSIDGDVVDHSSSINGVNGDKTLANITSLKDASAEAFPDVPLPTVNGGFTHTATSRAKISAANKGKTPWNKGKARSEEVRARIAEGVRRRNREKFLAKLEEEGITEEEYSERKKEERRKKDSERRARRTAKGGYTPTEETKKKISKVLKEKYATGEVKRKPRDPRKVRRGFRHTEETKQKIRESLRRKWAEDVEYRELMTNKTVANGQLGDTVRKRISETLKRKWEDPAFRASMMEKFANRKVSPATRDDSHRRRISEAMKKKWMDDEYRRRATEGMAKGREGRASAPRPVRPRAPRKPASKAASPVMATALTKKSKTSTKAKRKRRVVAKRKSTGGGAAEAVKPLSSSSRRAAAAGVPPREEEEEGPSDGSISRLREERRDLYDLLYGDDDEDHRDSGERGINGIASGIDKAVAGKRATGREANGLATPDGVGGGVASSDAMAALLGDDDDLDDFDPYGLHDTAPPPSFGRA